MNKHSMLEQLGDAPRILRLSGWLSGAAGCDKSVWESGMIVTSCLTNSVSAVPVIKLG